jgi:acyl-CoA synthetase (NDP forming)
MAITSRPPDSVALAAIFEPRRVAVVGASDKPGKLGTVFMQNLEQFRGEVVPINPGQDEVSGRRAYAQLRDVPDPIDLAVVVVPATAVPAVLADAADAGVRTAIVISGGFAETGEDGRELQDAALRATGGRVRVVGPNCFGVLNCHLGLNASIATGTPAAGGDISLVTQSGAYGMAIYTLGVEEQMRFAKVYAAGNKADVQDWEVLEYLADDDETEILCFFLESIERGREFCELASRTSQRKPIIVTRTGRTPAGARAATSHTAALANTTPVWRAALEQAGVVVARTGLEMFDCAKGLSWQPLPRGARVALITSSGGTGVELTDLLADEGLEVPELSPALQARLRELLSGHASPRNPVDITTDWRRFPELYGRCTDLLARSGEVDAVVPVLLQRSALDVNIGAAIRDVTARLRTEGIAIPLYVCWMGAVDAQPTKDLLQAASIPCFEWPARTATALGLAWTYARGRATVRQLPAAGEPASLGKELPSGLLEPDRAVKLLRAFGVEVAAHATVETPQEAADAAEQLGYPAVVKVIGHEISHKSDVGGVRLGLGDQAEVRRAARELFAIDGAEAVLVQRQLTGIETIVGAYRDEQFGPVVAVGLGGVFVETLGDIAFRLAPLNPPEARAAIESLRAFPILSGARGGPKANLPALADLLVAVSQLIAGVPEVREVDLNPVLASASGAVAVDFRIVVG